MRHISNLPEHERQPFEQFLAERLAQRPRPQGELGWFYEDDYRAFKQAIIENVKLRLR